MSDKNAGSNDPPPNQAPRSALFVNQQTFYPPEVVTSNVLRPDLFVNQQTFYPPEVRATPSAVANAAIAAVQTLAPPSSAKDATISAFKTIGNMGTPELAALKAQLVDPPSLKLGDYGIGAEVSLPGVNVLVQHVLDERTREQDEKAGRISARRTFMYSALSLALGGALTWAFGRLTEKPK